MENSIDERAGDRRVATISKSKGHLFFLDGYEWYKAGSEVYRAPMDAVIDVTSGYRIGRWEFPEWQLAERKKHGVYPFSKKNPGNLFRFGKPRKPVVDWANRKAREAYLATKGADLGPKPVETLDGVRIWKLGSQYGVSIDKDSRFDSLADARAFVRAWRKRNPAKMSAADLLVWVPGAYPLQHMASKAFGGTSVNKKKPASKKRAPKKRKNSAKSAARTTIVGVNPAKFDRCVKEVEKKGGAVSPYAVCTSAMQKAAKKRAIKKATKRTKNTSYRKTKKEVRKYQRSGMLDPGPMFQKHRKYAKISKKGRRKNPIDTATKAYVDFHGLPSTEIVEIVEHEHRHSVTAGIGKLVELKILTATGRAATLEFGLTPGRAVLVSTSEDGRQLFFKWGDQKLNLKVLGFSDRDTHDSMYIGVIKQIVYRDRKSFEAGGQEEVDFVHTFGKEGSAGVLPILIYEPRNSQLKVSGGRYFIAPPDKRLKGAGAEGTSPGIIG